MARPLDDRQQADLSAFVNDLAQRANYTTTAEWARDSGYPASNLSNLRNGKGAVDGYNLLKLIRAAAARIEMPVDSLAVASSRSGAAEGWSNEELALRLEEVAALVAEGLLRLGAGASASTQLPPGEADQAQGTDSAP